MCLFLSITGLCIISYFMDKQKSYGENYQQVELKHTLSKKFYLMTGGACLFAVACILVVVLVI